MYKTIGAAFGLAAIFFANTGDPKTVGNIFIDRFWKWIRFLENHSDLFPQLCHIHVRRIDIGAIDSNFAGGDFSVIDQVVHPVKAPQQG